MSVYSDKCKQQSVIDLQNTALRERKEYNSKKLESIVKTVLLCGRQNIALRGHRDDAQHIENERDVNCGNFQALLDFRIESGDEILRKHFETAPRNATYRSKTIQNELIKITGDMIREQIVKDLKEGGYWFSVSADEVRDVTNKEQMAVTVRFIDKTGNIREEFMGFVDVSDDTTGERLSVELLQCLKEWNLDPSRLRSQCYDGAGNMSGKIKGVGPRIQRQFPKALPFWCTSHQLNRCIVAASDLTSVRNLMATADKVVRFFNYSPKRQTVLEGVIDEVIQESNKKKLKELCRTRWVERHEAFEIFLQLYPAIVAALDDIKLTEKRTEALTDAIGLSTAIQSFEFLTTLVVTTECLGYLKPLSTALQGKNVDIIDAVKMVDTTQSALKDVRENIDTYFNEWYKKACEIGDEIDVAPKIPRICGRQTKRNNIPADTPDTYYKRVIAIPFLDNLLTQMDDRFSALHEKALLGFRMIPGVKDFENASVDNFSYFVDDLPSVTTFNQELHTWKVKWKNVINKPVTLKQTLLECPKMSYPNIHTVLSIVSTFPVTSCECERSISSLRLLKTFLRSAMGQDRMTSLAMMYVHRDININIKEVVRVFAHQHPRKMVLPNIMDENDQGNKENMLL